VVKRKINATVMLDPEDFEVLTELSRKTGESISGLIREAVKQFLGREEKKSE